MKGTGSLKFRNNLGIWNLDQDVQESGNLVRDVDNQQITLDIYAPLEVGGKNGQG